MLVRTQQMETLSGASVDTFESRMTAHLRRCFPAKCEEMKEDGVHAVIQYGIERARGYGITAERDVCRYIDVMMVYGRDFDRDPALPWAGAILSGKRWPEPTARVDQLYQAAKE